MSEPVENTDVEIWRAKPGDYYSDSVHVTENESLGINCGGSVFVKPINEWHRLAVEDANRRAPAAEQQQQEPVIDRSIKGYLVHWYDGHESLEKEIPPPHPTMGQTLAEKIEPLYTHQQPQVQVEVDDEDDGEEVDEFWMHRARNRALNAIRKAQMVEQPQVQGEPHIDDITVEEFDDMAVDRFAVAMKKKLAKKRAQGRGGWDDKSQCSESDLSYMLIDHLRKGDPIDIGNFAMMLQQRGEKISTNVLPDWLCDLGRPRAAVPDGWRFEWQLTDNSILIHCPYHFPFTAHHKSQTLNLAESILHWLATDILAAAPAQPGAEQCEHERQRDQLLAELEIVVGSIKEICAERGIPLPISTIRRAEAAMRAALEAALAQPGEEG